MEEEIYTNSCNRGKGCTIIQRYNNCNEPGYNTYTCKKNEEMSNIYSSTLTIIKIRAKTNAQTATLKMRRRT